MRAQPQVDSEDPTAVGGEEEDARPRSKMSLHQIWTFIEDSKRTGVSLEKLAAVRDREDHAGVNKNSVPYRARKVLSMYRKQSRLAFLGTNKLCICTDGSNHSNHDFLVSVAYHASCDAEAAAYCTAQHINTAKVLFPGQMLLTEEVEVLAARREVSRLASLKFVQALSAQIQSLSSGHLSLPSFWPSEDLALLLQPLQPGDRRYFNGSEFEVQFGNRDEPVKVQLADSSLPQIPVLRVLMDQGKIGMAASAFCQSLGLLVKWDWDKVHRLIRDVKSMSYRLEQCVLACTYMWSINYKPFSSGLFFDEKRNVLTAFFESNNSEPWHQWVDFILRLIGLKSIHSAVTIVVKTEN